MAQQGSECKERFGSKFGENEQDEWSLVEGKEERGGSKEGVWGKSRLKRSCIFHQLPDGDRTHLSSDHRRRRTSGTETVFLIRRGNQESFGIHARALIYLHLAC